MDLKRHREHRRRSRWVEGLFGKNPVMVLGLSLPFAVMVTTTLKSGAAISLLMACSLIPTVLMAALVGNRLPPRFSIILYALFSMCMVMAGMPLIGFISPEVSDALGIFIPVMGINTTMFMLCDRAQARKTSMQHLLADTLSYTGGFALAVCLIAAIREIFGYNTIWGIALKMPIKLAGMQYAFCGFIVTAFLAALWRMGKRLLLRWRIATYAREREVHKV